MTTRTITIEYIFLIIPEVPASPSAWSAPGFKIEAEVCFDFNYAIWKNMKEDKISYETPVTTIVEVKQEGVICASGTMQDYNWTTIPEE
jgi:hypothetical protein